MAWAAVVFDPRYPRRKNPTAMQELLTAPELVLPLVGLAAACALWSFSSWVRGTQVLIVGILFGGIIGARLGNTALPIIFRDALIVLPLYVAFFFGKAGRDAVARVPTDLAIGLCAVFGWLIICLFNSNVGSSLQLLIGLKVWAFYIPFLLVGIALASRPDALFKVFRLLLVCGLAVCGVGMLQGLLIRVIGYGPAITLFFGTSAASVTQGFAASYTGGAIYRIPATFSFGSQYVAFLFLFLTVAVIEANADPAPRFQTIGRIAFYVGILAGLFSGTKAAFVAFPLIAVAYAACGLIRARLLIVAPIAIAVAVWAFNAAGLDPIGLASFGADQARRYSEGFIFNQIADATRYGVFGQGIGASTGAAQFAAIGADFGTRLGFESYYAKVAAELGTIGLVIFAIFFIVIAVRTGTLLLTHRRTQANALIAPLAIYVLMNLVYSFKGFVIDTDPGNIFFWLTLGLMFRLDRDLWATSGRREFAAPSVHSTTMVGGARLVR